VTASIRHRAELLASALPPLLIEAERVASTVMQGVHGRRRAGQGEAFWQFRRYAQGDPITRIDWRQSARTQAVFVRENEWEAAQSVWLWRDASSSMAYRSKSSYPTKRDRADLLLLATAAMLLRGGERTALLGQGGPPANSRATLIRLAASLDQGGYEAGLPPSVLLPRYGRVVLFGDFLSPLDEIKAKLAGFAGAGAEGHLVQVLDLAERSLPFKGRVRFEGMEGEGTMLARRAEKLRDEYQDRIEEHCAGIADLARSVGWSYRIHVTSQSAEVALLALYGVLAGARAK
jgi:uncharacterized protein (DUF58 family)